MNLRNKHKFVLVGAIKAPITPRSGGYQSPHYTKAQNYLITL